MPFGRPNNKKDTMTCGRTNNKSDTMPCGRPNNTKDTMPCGRSNNKSYNNNRVGSPWDLTPIIKTKRDRSLRLLFHPTNKTKDVKPKVSALLFFYSIRQSETFKAQSFYSIQFNSTQKNRRRCSSLLFHLHNQRKTKLKRCSSIPFLFSYKSETRIEA